MKSHLYIFLLLSSILQGQIIELPYTLNSGWGDIKDKGFGGIDFGRHDPESSWGKMEVETKGAPGFSVQRVDTDIVQFVWQNYTNGKITKDMFELFLKAWDIDTLSKNLTRDYIRCYLNVAIKKENDNQYLYIVDTNNDHDFSDETIHIAEKYNYAELDELYRENAVSFTYEAFAADSTEIRQGEILILESSDTFKEYMAFMYAFVYHCSSTLTHKGKKYKLDFQFSSGLRLQTETEINVQDPITKQKITKDESIIIENHGFRVIGVDPSKKVLLLEKYLLDPNKPLAQKGFFAPEIEGVEFSSGDSLKLSDYRGKYVLLYIWATWCQPCYGSLPKLVTVNDSISSDHLQIFSAHFNSNPDALPSVIEQNNIHWPQLLHTQCVTDLQADYIKNGVPFSCLIDPEGKIIEVGIHVKPNLSKVLQELME